MRPFVDQLKLLSKQLLPTGRAFWAKVGGDYDKLITALNLSDAQAYTDAVSTLNSAIPDNDQFSEDDATAWEIRLGLITNPAVSLEDRKAAIIRKMNHPGTQKARQNYLYLQAQLQAAGFDVYVYENIFPDGMGGYTTKTPDQFSLLPYPRSPIRYGFGRRYGLYNYGFNYGNKVANSMNQSDDDFFSIGQNLKCTFFIGGSSAGNWASVDTNRQKEFRQLILKIKPVQTVAFLLVNYI